MAIVITSFTFSDDPERIKQGVPEETYYAIDKCGTDECLVNLTKICMDNGHAYLARYDRWKSTSAVQYLIEKTAKMGPINTFMTPRSVAEALMHKYKCPDVLIEMYLKHISGDRLLQLVRFLKEFKFCDKIYTRVSVKVTNRVIAQKLIKKVPEYFHECEITFTNGFFCI